MFCCFTLAVAKTSIDTEKMPSITELETIHIEEGKESREFETKTVKEMPESDVFMMQNAKDMPESTVLDIQNTQAMPGSPEFVIKSIDEMSVSAVRKVQNAKEMPESTVLDIQNTQAMTGTPEFVVKSIDEMPASTVLEMKNAEEMRGSSVIEMQNIQEMPGSTEFVIKSIHEMPAASVFEMKNAEEMQGSNVIEMQNTQEMPGSSEFVIKSIDGMPASTVLEMQGSDMTEEQNTEEMQWSTEVDIPNEGDIAVSTAFVMKMTEDIPERSTEVEVKNPEGMLATSEFEIKTTDNTAGNCQLEMDFAREGEDIAVAPEADFELDNAQMELPPGTVIFSPHSRMKAPSRYLRNSLSSCHDLCKYGTQDFIEVKGGSSIQNKSISTLGLDQDVEKTTTPTGGTRQKGTSHKHSPLAAKNEFASCILRKGVIIYGSYDSSSTSTNIGAGKELQPLKVGQKEISRPPFSLSPRTCGIKKTERSDKDKLKNLKRASRMKDGKNAVKTETEHENCEEIEEKIIRVVEPEAEKKQDGSTLTKSGSNATGLSPSMVTIAGRTSNSSPNRPRAQASLLHQDSSLRKSKNATPRTRLAPTLSFPESRNSRLSSHLRRSSTTLSPSSTITEEDSPKSKESATSKQPKTMKQEQKSTNSPKKPSTRKRMSPNLQSENKDARRLRFRQTKPASETSTGKDEIRRRRFAKKETDSEVKTPDIKSEKVVLRHQDVKEKKDEKDYNNVIEETANKLVQTRKSKVKALVGAFETVISLQELKPSRSSI